MASAALLLVLSSLLATTFSLSCTECSGEGAKLCQGAAVTCLSDFDACVATIESVSKDGKETTLSRQYCGEKTMCSYTGSLTTDHEGRRVSSTCCFTSTCIPPMPKLPTEKPEKNGLSCQACSTERGTTCRTIECTGDEKQCVSITTETKTGLGSVSVSGCGSPGWCAIKEREFQYGGQTSEITLTCSSSSEPRPLLRPLPLLLLLLIMKAVC